jgi:aminoglycoside phosphotransferase (APT) family kinase protein
VVADAAAERAAELESFLRERSIDARVEVTGRATVGLSQETWFVRLHLNGQPPAEAVLRLPTQASGGQAINTQRIALQAVEGHGVPAPALLWFDDDAENPFRRPVLVMERAPGRVPVGWRSVDEPARSKLAVQAVEILAALHAIDPAPLQALIPSGHSAPTELDWYTRFLRRYEPLPGVLRAGLWWLERHRPAASARSALVHGDFRMGNLMVMGDRISGVLDWEMAAPGDPLADLAWCFIPVWETAGVDEPALVARYGELTGTVPDPQRLRWHRVLGYVRLAYYMLSASGAFDSGGSNDLRLGALRLQLPVHLDRLAATLAGEPPS